ncbi:MAG: Eco57I restriction-modification methylase domain-containing protein, partial [Gemmatimonadota bacterium]|nr:Eco57I restriction-modification methylase domain-containing protein [Gemmatimonadota bacterium]
METDARTAMGNAIRVALGGFEAGSLRDRAEGLLRILGYESERYEADFDLDPTGFLEWADEEAPRRRIAKRPRDLILENWNRIQMVFQYTSDELAPQVSLFDTDRSGYEKSRAKSFLFLGVDLKDDDHPRHRLAAMTRAINRPLMMPAIIFFRYRRDDGSMALTLAVIHRRAHRRDAASDVLERATLIKDIRVADPHRAHLDMLTDLALESLVLENRTFDALHRAWQEVLDTEALNRRFYTRLFEWFEYAVATCSFPDDGAGDGNSERHVIRMITRLLFIWFLKEKRLVPEEFFEDGFADEQLNDHRSDSGHYYRAVLQNLFFATLNTPIDRRSFSSESQSTHRDFTKFRYKRLLRDPDGFKKQFDSVPFVNGGLFDCLDTFEHRGAGGRRIDAFTDTDQGKDLHVPAHVFFDEDHGLFQILRKYKFTVEENTPLDQEVALDPELLGKTFENLLAAYNPETREHARKKTGSYYTPREVVDYMVQEALVEHLSLVVEPYDRDQDWLKERLRHLLAINQGEGVVATRRKPGRPPGTEDHLIHSTEIDPLIEAIDRMRIIDPACGSGAFPMGILQKLVMVLGKMDPRNERWKARQIAAAEKIEDPAIRKNAVRTVELAFSEERGFGDFGRKLYLIQNVIHGVDIQPIATQIAKLRFFISLVIEQPTSRSPEVNFGLEPLPNLETCFVAADSLKRLARPEQAEIRSADVEQLENALQAHRRNWFDAHDRDAKWELRKRDRHLRGRLRRALLDAQWDESAAHAIANWDAYDQNARADWFDPEWMFGLTAGFDIVIGNPPYVALQKNGSELANRYHNDSFQAFARTGDLYVLFCERGVGLLRSSTGILAYITSNSWLKAKYGKKLRRFLSNGHTPLRLLEMGGDVFENAIVDSSVVIVRHGGHGAPLPAVDLDLLPNDMSFPELPDDAWGEVRPSKEEPWSIMSLDEWRVMDKMRAVGTPLKDWDDISI